MRRQATESGNVKIVIPAVVSGELGNRNRLATGLRKGAP